MNNTGAQFPLRSKAEASEHGGPHKCEPPFTECGRGGKGRAYNLTGGLIH
ncbi:MAG TPA: hypothetical protein VK762_12005 [Polyangiaceae bacterium]|nr:hypothetical protein [Polyangiaceae bacterium]